MQRIAVIGGGIAGLAAGWSVSQSAQAELTLFEGSNRLGGVLETVRDGPYLIERAADNFATMIPDALELSKSCGLADDLIRPNAEGRQAFVLNRGRVLPIPAGFSLMQPTRVGSILATRTLSWKAKLRMLAEFWTARRDSEEDESLESFATRRLGREAFENLVEPIVSGIFTADPSTLSMAATMPQFVKMERQHGSLIRGHLAARRQDSAAAARKASGARYDQFMAPREGMSSWVAGIAATLPQQSLRLNTSVAKLWQDVEKKSWWLLSQAGEKFEFDAVICAMPAAATALLLRDCQPKAAEIVGGIPYASSAVVAMVVNKADLLGRKDGFGLIVPRKENRQSLAISYSSNKYPGRVPEDQILLRVFLGGALRPEVVEYSDERLTEIAASELREILGWTANQANWQAVIRWKESMPQYLVGHVKRMQALQAELSSIRTLKLCGAAYDGVGIPQCIRGARKVARELLDDYEKRTP
jgi:protoporphyrinogen/coproporphyrinogen III oxidase